MGRFGKNIAAFLFVLVFAYVTLAGMWSFLPQLFKPNINYRIGSTGHLFTRVLDLKNQSEVDILFIGSSHAYRGFDTRIFKEAGFSSFNLGSSGQTPITGQVLLKRYIERLNPRLIVYEVFPGSFNSDGVESSLDIIANDRNDINSLKMALKINSLKTYNTLIIGILRDFLNTNKGFQESREKKSGTYIEGGYVQQEQTIQRLEEITPRQWNFDQKQFKAFEENLKFIQEGGRKVILIKAPVSKTLYNAFTDNEAYDSIMHSYGDYFNFNELVELEDTLHFSDTHHLNHSGVEIFNKKVIDLLPFEELLEE